MDPNHMPLLGALLRHSRHQHAGFHVPGHKSGKGLLPAAAIFREVMSIDLTEITGLDDLHHPEGAIRDAQQLAAACFGAEETFFLVNGSTVGNLAAILSLCDQGDTLIVQRNVHKSVIHGLMLAGAKAVFLSPRYDPASGLPAGIGTEQVELALQRYPEAKGVLITNPNYYGMGVDIRKLAALAHAHGKPLLIDEAHGAHYGFHPALPDSALACGADLVVQSTHKMLGAMTMGAMLHIRGSRIDRERVRNRLSMLQSSSPSYPIMASLDASRCLLQTVGRSWLDLGLSVVERFEKSLERWPWFRAISRAPTEAYETKDPFKVAIADATATLSGFQLRDELERRGVMTEMADPCHVLLVFSFASETRDADMLIGALEHISARFELSGKEISLSPEVAMKNAPYHSGVSAPVPFRMNALTATKETPVSEAAGEIAAEMVIPYPPGIPVLYPGELITEQTVQDLRALAAMGAKFQGVSDPLFRKIRVFLHKK
ncbi:aminotransferase class I/II-fold pyridoxal phosphate-dependent enzyme [Paenibacillus mesophilus]|uniref:aminotransferase class I/II-fold pyridoxal phosphate-dependent enzyme n=1 Tax=Paenibacillus mesophilus TaxID=2582849 RepID=UPI00110E26AD|nr:aminotransferase class I/II-fold pyridoxal phosphate-dependent enzyme [Paenibacillus mesophilus]TMV44250.1 aminotransferase class I/II-fold pyridoxal phosphate-dependent enzyme [Paenibacillus mesophilus]